jgi:lysyl-tRNA synthetase class 1
MFHQPTRAKRLHFDVIPRHVDDYLGHLQAFAAQEPEAQLENPLWHVHAGAPPAEVPVVTFGLLLNLAAVCGTGDKAVLWGFISRYAPTATPATHPLLDELVGHAVRYFENFIRPNRHHRPPTDEERMALGDLARTLEALPPGVATETIQAEVYEVGKRHQFADLRAWFRSLYEVLLGHPDGPRMGSFVELYGVAETIALIRRRLAGSEA